MHVLTFAASTVAEIARLTAEKDVLIQNPYTFRPGIRFHFKPILCLCDGKVENAKVGNTSQQRCPKCGKLPWEYKLVVEQDPMGGSDIFTVEELWDIILSPLHIALRGVDGWIRLACLKTFGIAFCAKENEKQYEDRFKEIQQAYLDRGDDFKKIYVGFVRPDGGTSTNGFDDFRLKTLKKISSA